MNAVDHPATAASPERLRLTEIFLSLQGESRTIGLPTVFVRLTGCPLRCQYGDTAYAFHGGEWWDYDGILAEVARHGVRHVCVTGASRSRRSVVRSCCAGCATPGMPCRWRPPARWTSAWSTPASRGCSTSRRRVPARWPATCGTTWASCPRTTR